MDLHEELFGKVKPESLTDEFFGVDTKPSDFATATALFESRGWETRLAGFGILTSPLYRYGYYFLSREMDTKTIITQEGLDKMDALDGIGIEYQQMIIAHEVRKAREDSLVQVDWVGLGHKMANATATVARGVGKILLYTVAVPAALLIDPRLIIVLNDSDSPWFEVHKWDIESGV